MLINVTRMLTTMSFPYSLLMKSYRCRKSVEIHDKRHREIAELLQTVLRLDEVAANNLDSVSLFGRKRKTRKSNGFELLGVDVETEGKDEEDEWADTSTACEDELDIGRLSLTDKTGNTNITKIHKQGRKAAKPHERFHVITDEDVSKISDALHPYKSPLFDKATGHDLLNNSFVDANVSFDPRTFKYSSLRQEIHERKHARANDISKASNANPDPDTRQITAILERLGLDAGSTIKLTKERKNVFNRLYDAVEKDLICVENEEREIMMRMAGYWRFANKRTYNYMIRKNELWDWATGDKLLEIDEEGETEDDERGDTFSQQGTDVASVGKDGGDFLSEHEKLLDDEKATSSLDYSPGKRNHDVTRPLSSDKSSKAAEENPASQSPWQGIRDTRHLNTPTRTITTLSPSYSDTDNTSPESDIPSPSPAIAKSGRYYKRPHLDPNNRFSPLTVERSPLPRAAILRLSVAGGGGEQVLWKGKGRGGRGKENGGGSGSGSADECLVLGK